MSEVREPGGTVLACESLIIGWGGRPLLPEIDMEIVRGRLLAVVGRNGSGKTTWLKTLLGLTAPVSGLVRRHVDDMHAAYVAQSSGVSSMLSVRARDVVSWGRLSGWSFLRPFSAKADQAICDQAMADAQASHLADHNFRELSKGQRQRVLFARMLAAQPDIALLDEPTAAMDLSAERQSLKHLGQVARDREIAIVLISHAIDIAVEQADDVLLFDRVHDEVVFGPKEEVVESAAFRRYAGGHDQHETVDDDV